MTLKAELDEFGKLFKHHLNGSMKATFHWVTATGIDWDKQTMTATDADDLEYFDVLLGVGSVAIKPVVNTDCLIAIVEGNEATAFLLYANEIELIQYNGGENGGLLKIQELTDKLNELKDVLNALVQLYNTHTHAVSTTGTATAQSGTAAAIISTANEASEFSKDDYEDLKITH